MMIAALALPALTLWGASPDTIAAAGLYPPMRTIDSLEIRCNGALTGSKVLSKGDSIAYQAAEWLRDRVFHNRTRTTTVARRLLFRVGDTLDPVRFSESERLMRGEKFLADVKITDTVLADNRTLVRVETWDQWSTNIPLSLNRAGGELNWYAGFSESNLLGTGTQLGGLYWHTPLRTTVALNFLNYSFLRRGQLLQMIWNENSDGHEGIFAVGNPLRSRLQKTGWLAEYQDAELTRMRFLGGAVQKELEAQYPGDTTDWTRTDGLAFLYPHSRRQLARASYTRVFGEGTQLLVTAQSERERDSSGAPAISGQIPTALVQQLRTEETWDNWRTPLGDRDDLRAGFQVALRQEEFRKRRNFNSLKWSEDIPVGWQLDAMALPNLVSRGVRREGVLLQMRGRWSGMTDHSHGALSGGWRGFAGAKGEGGNEGMASWRLEARRFHSPHAQTIVSAAGDVLTNVKPGQSQLVLGEDNGLPGFAARSFQGLSRQIWTSEIRWTPALEALTVAPALALFAGAGRCGDDTQILGSGKWHAGAGVGLRFGLTRSVRGVVNHISFARPVGEEGGRWSDPSHWIFSFGAKQSL